MQRTPTKKLKNYIFNIYLLQLVSVDFLNRQISEESLNQESPILWKQCREFSAKRSFTS